MTSPPRLVVQTTDYHTAGEPFRIVAGGPAPSGETVLDKRSWYAENADHIRRLLVNEPRGHADMYGCFVVPPDDADGDLGTVFFHNSGYSTACGHGTIALVTWAIDSGLISAPRAGIVNVVVDVPSGRLRTTATVVDGRVERVSFRNVPSFVLLEQLEIQIDGQPLSVGVSFGGAFYAMVRCADVGLAVHAQYLPELIRSGRAVKAAVEATVDVVHPLESRLRDVYGVIFTEPAADESGRLAQRNVTIFADGEVDRSPCGSGTSARLAALHANGELGLGDVFVHHGIAGGVFLGRVLEETSVAGRQAVVTEVSGRAHVTGHHTFVLDPADELGTGFQLR
jgi:proline racemase/trans-L-3-hydroxyproline dehydratase